MQTAKNEVEKVIEETTDADQSTQQLTTAAHAMNKVVEVIQQIAGQINLLALNATIEAARAGEAGKGFSVVASEVKSLATQVAKATEQISSEIGSMQIVSDNVVNRLQGIKDAVGSVEMTVTTVASAVEQQTATTKEVTFNMQKAATEVTTISTSLETIAGSIHNANTLAQQGIELYRSIQKDAVKQSA